MANIVGREKELKVLEKLANSVEPEFLAIYGRRRVGKTFLISEFFKDKGIYFEVTGVKNASKAEQLRHFSEELGSRFFQGKKPFSFSEWSEALLLLKNKVEEIPENQKVILFFDEVPWLSSKKSGFMEALEHCWNRYLSRKKNVILIVCGSAASWMIKKIIYNKGGLYGRLTAQIRLMPFELAETEQFLQSRGVDLNRKQIVEIYMALGGVAKYLTYVERGKSAAEVIQEICFSKTGPLHAEFYRLYESLFDHASEHIRVVKALAKKWSGMSMSELLHATQLASGGGFTTLLRELEESGFILWVPDFGKKKREGKYRLVDEFSLFYLSWIEEAAELKALQKDYWMRMQSSSSYLVWAGYAFEGICIKHIGKIIEALGLSVVATASAGWSLKAKKGIDAESGAQIDLIIDRADQCINLCEIKFHRSEFEVDKNYAQELERKKQCFLESTKTKKSLFTTLITPYGAKKNVHYASSVSNQLTFDDLFKAPR